MPLAVQQLNESCDTLYPTTGTYGVALLLNGVVQSGVVWTVDAATDIITLNTAQVWLTGTRLRVTNTGGALPTISVSSLSTSTDYFWIRLSSTTGRLTTTLAFAQAGTPTIDFTGTGTGTQNFAEQTLSVEDPLPVLILKEVVHTNYVRTPVASLPAAVNGIKTFTWSQPVASGQPSLVYTHRFLVRGGLITLGDTTGTKNHLFTETSAVTITAGSNPLLAVNLRISN